MELLQSPLGICYHWNNTEKISLAPAPSELPRSSLPFPSPLPHASAWPL